MEDLIRDTRYGLRLLARSPIFTATAVLSLALGIGANAAIFHLIDSLTLRSLAMVKPHELVEVRPDGPQAFGTYDGANAKATYPLWEQIRRQPERVLRHVRVGRRRIRRGARGGSTPGRRTLGER